jgi:hypothetical protein
MSYEVCNDDVFDFLIGVAAHQTGFLICLGIDCEAVLCFSFLA